MHTRRKLRTSNRATNSLHAKKQIAFFRTRPQCPHCGRHWREIKGRHATCNAGHVYDIYKQEPLNGRPRQLFELFGHSPARGT